MSHSMKVHVIDVESGNLQSLANSIRHTGDYEVCYIRDAGDFAAAGEITKLIFPGVGNYGHFLRELKSRNLLEPLRTYVDSGRDVMGICVGLQTFFRSSEESSEPGMGLLDLDLSRFKSTESDRKSVPHMGWSGIHSVQNLGAPLYGLNYTDRFYFVHSFAGIVEESSPVVAAAAKNGWSFAFSQYGSERFIAAVAYKNLFATQFHPEKSGFAGLNVIRAFLTNDSTASLGRETRLSLAPRIIACLDVRSNDKGDLVVTKGDQYDVRHEDAGGKGAVRNLGKPVELATKYYEQGADEIVFLNITSFRQLPLADLPMLEVLRLAAAQIFVPLTVGGGIKDTEEPGGRKVPAVEIADLYFRAGADKVSIGSEAVRIAEEYYASGRPSGVSAIETISKRFGNQAVVISVDPKRKYVLSPQDTKMATIEIDDAARFGPNGERYCYYQVTSHGGRNVHDLGALELCVACERLGAGEILLNSIDHDGTNQGFNLELVRQIKGGVGIPVIASSGAGSPDHFREVFEDTKVDAALGAGMFHRGEHDVGSVKRYLAERGFAVRS